MFTKQEQRSWIRIEVARSRSAQNCYQGLREARGDAALPYRTVARWVKLFREEKNAIQDNRRSGRPQVDNHTIQLLSSLLDVDRRWAAWELAAEVGVCHKTVLHILHDILGYRKIAALWVTHTMSEVQQWQHYAFAQDFLGRIVTLDETWAHSYEPHLKRQSTEWKHPGSPRPKKVHPTQSNVKVMFIVACYTDEVILHRTLPQRRTVNAAYYCNFLRNHLRPALRRKRRHLLATNPIVLHNNAAGDGRYCNIRHSHPI
ncbi:hypothetical protein B7P43_G13766 [Cryptotermes secundus]|uniref:Mos1 transposase HTH domain-containing protein n=1 Tax=Cryptotermes secundus TaxID=105785 RepID=A0A2J7RSD5_9NEOP|nr:hypothetical protein B7P43_G13766 [Cryptotermes secundus]